MKNAYTLVMSGELFSADTAYELGWADIYTEKKQGVPEAVSLIDYISKSTDIFVPSEYKEYISSYLKNREA